MFSLLEREGQELHLALLSYLPSAVLASQGPSCLCVIPRNHFVGANSMVSVWELGMERNLPDYLEQKVNPVKREYMLNQVSTGTH